MDITFNSPDSRFVTRLVQPRVFQADGLPGSSAATYSYYKTIWLADQRFTGRFLTGKALWSADSRYFAAEEWNIAEATPDAFGRHDRRLVVFDVINSQAAIAATVAHGTLAPVHFEDGVLLCHQSRAEGADAPDLLEVQVGALSPWVPMGCLRDMPL